MDRLFRERQRLFLTRCLKYFRYVFNDHFVLFLLVFVGFISLQYRQLLENFPTNPWLIYLLLAVVSLLLFLAGQMASYIESADAQFLLPKEKEVVQVVVKAGQRQFLLWGLVQVIGQLVLLPLYLKLGLPVWLFAVGLSGLSLGKYALIQLRLRSYQHDGIFQWERAVVAETKRKQSILQFFALFTQVKGITTSVKRRTYLDVLLNGIATEHKQTWLYLYARAFLRSGDFLSLTLRLAGISLLGLLAIEQAWLSIGLVLLFDYLLLFQLLALFRVYDYQYLTLLYPIDVQMKLRNFQTFLRTLLYGILGLQGVVAGFVLTDKIYLLYLVIGGIFLNQFYLSIKAKKLID